MFVRIVLFVAEVGSDLLAAAFLARFILQWTRASFRNPIGQFIIAVTDWAVRPLRKLVPGLFGLDMASLLLAWLAQLAYLALAYFLTSVGPGMPLLPVLVASIIELARLAVHLAMGVVLIAALLSWVNPYAPLAPFFNDLARPLLAPIQRFMPPTGGIDLSPLVLLLALQVLLMVLENLRVMAFGIGL